MAYPTRTRLLSLLLSLAAILSAPAAAQPPCTGPSTPLLVDLNAASEDELQKLPRIGPARARAIVRVRTHLGGFKRISQLLRVKGIGRATLRQLRPHVTLATRKVGAEDEDPVP